MPCLLPPRSWAQSPVGTTAQQCKASASMDPRDIISGMSDGVRDTPAQSLNSTNNPVTNILRFIGCDEQTGAYTNTTANAQQSCNSANGFPAGDRYLNNYNNLMRCGRGKLRASRAAAPVLASSPPPRTCTCMGTLIGCTLPL